MGKTNRILDTTRNIAIEKLTQKASPLILSTLFRLIDLRLRIDRGFRNLIYDPNTAHSLSTLSIDVSDLHNQNRVAKKLHFRNGRNWHSLIRLATRDKSFSLDVQFEAGRVRIGKSNGKNPHATLLFRDLKAVSALLLQQENQQLDMLLTGDLVLKGNLSDLARIGFLLSAFQNLPLFSDSKKQGLSTRPLKKSVCLPKPKTALPMLPQLKARYLQDPAFSDYTIGDFPRLSRFRSDFFSTDPEICTERALLYTEGIKKSGFESDSLGAPVDPELRQAEAFYYLMANRKPIIRSGDLIAGTTTSKPIGVLIYPECGGIPIWPELYSMTHRSLNPYQINERDIRLLNQEVLPFWMDRNVREFTRSCQGNPISLQLDERFVFYFQWKTQSVSHTIVNYEAVLQRGLSDIAQAAQRKFATTNENKKQSFYRSMERCIEGIITYANALSQEAASLAQQCSESERRSELEELSRICRKVPAHPADSLHEAIQSIWTVWIGCHMENTNAGLSIGRLDQWLQPYFERDINTINAPSERKRYIERALELVGCLYLRCTDHLPQVADLGNKLFGGSSSNQVITLGGITKEGNDAVNDMTYICLKVTEMLCLRDPNINARYYEGINPVEYLRRLCEVNYLTCATPSIHGDQRLIDVLVDQGITLEHARDWSATGCVEPTSCGRHYAHTNCMMFNLVAPFVMSLHNGHHPLMEERIGPHTGDPRCFETWAEFLDAYYSQLRFLIETATEANNILGLGHQFVRPTPFLSCLIDGPMEKGKDLIEGGAVYNSSGIGNVGLVDVIDSLIAVKKLVFDDKRVSMTTLLEALEDDFEGHQQLLSWIENRVPKFGQGNSEVLRITDQVVDFIHHTFRAQPHFRGGHYNSGFWSMSNHVAFGLLTSALPSGRRKGKAFTPGLTPAPCRNTGLLQQIQDVAQLDHKNIPNNLAFNLKLIPHPGDSQSRTLDYMTAYARSYFQTGGMQLQFNVVSSETLRDARQHPEQYPSLMVRISGYNAYFNDLNDDMKIELIERTEHHLKHRTV